MMNRNELVTNIVIATGIGKETVERVLLALAGEITLALSNRETVVLPRMGSFCMIGDAPVFTPARVLSRSV